MFCCASIDHKYSLPMRRAGSPVQLSSGPRMPKCTFACCITFENAVATLRSARKALGDAPIVSGALGYAYAVAGRSEEAGQTMELLIADSPARYVTPVANALIWLGLGEMDRAFDWLEKGVGDRSWWLAWLKVDPLFDRARSDPRFESLLAQVGV